MNGLAAAPQPPNARAERKRALMEELVQLRTQKAEVLKQIQQIAKRQKTGGLPTKASELLAGNNRLVLQMEQRNRAEKVSRGAGPAVGPLRRPGEGWARRAREQAGGRAPRAASSRSL